MRTSATTTCVPASVASWRSSFRSEASTLYTRGSEYARERGIIIADTKFEFGLVDDELILIDEVLTPDSSRFWPADEYQPGRGQPSFDKQFVRDWLTQKSGWDKNSPPPELPAGDRRKVPGPSISRRSSGSPARSSRGSDRSAGCRMRDARDR